MSTKKPTASQIAAKEAEARSEDDVVIKENTAQQNPTVVEAKHESKKRVVAKKRGKNYVAAQKKLKEFKALPLPISEAIRQLKSASYAKFDETYELHINTLETGLKGEVEMPHSTGKVTRVAIANDEVISALEKGIIDFDVLIASPGMMPKLTKFAKLLGPKGLMPNPKAGTVSADPDAAAQKFSGNALRYKTEGKAPIIHLTIGKKSFSDDQLTANIEAVMHSLDKSKIKSIYICATMSPSVQIIL